MRAGALGVDAEEVALRRGSACADVSAPSAARRAGPVDRHLAGAGEELLLEPALDARGGEVLRLRDERHPPRQRERHEQPVGVRQVVAGQDRGALVGDVLGTLGVRAEDQPQERAEGDPLQEPVEHRRPPPCCSPSTPGAPATPEPRAPPVRPVRGRRDDPVAPGCTRPRRSHRPPPEQEHPWPSPPTAEPFFAAADPDAPTAGAVGVLLVHGFTGSPASMRPWGEYLAGQGYAVAVPRLPGHGTTWQE